MPRSAPRIPERLLDAVVRLDDGKAPIARTIRLVGGEADRLGITRPSYERLRQLIHEARAVRRRRGPAVAQIVLEGGAGLRTLESGKRALTTPRDERR